MDVFAYYRRLEAQLAKSKGQEAPCADHTSEASVSQSTAATPKVPPTVPSVGTSASVSAPSPDDAAERDRQCLRAEVAGWDLRVSQAEIEHIITHHPYSRARQLLWKTRVDAPVATPIEAAAD